jgi:hypothetical protein
MVLSLGLGRMISSPQHLRLQSIEVGFEACLVHLAGVMGFGEKFAGIYRKKRNKRSDADDVMDKTFKTIIHDIRLSGINIPKNALLPSQLPAPVSSNEEKDMDGNEEEDGHDREEEHAHDSEEDGREQYHWNANGDEANEVHSDSRSPMLDTIDNLIEPTAFSL